MSRSGRARALGSGAGTRGAHSCVQRLEEALAAALLNDEDGLNPPDLAVPPVAPLVGDHQLRRGLAVLGTTAVRGTQR